MQMTKQVLIRAAVATTLVAVSVATAGPDHNETGDAGSLRSTAQKVTKFCSDQTLVSIAGSLPTSASAVAGAEDLEDMFLIRIVDPMHFEAKITPPKNCPALTPDCCPPVPPNCCSPGTPECCPSGTPDLQLWLFRPDGPVDAFGLLSNDDGFAGCGTPHLVSTAKDLEGATIPAPGEYLLAISRKGRFPTAGGKPIFSVADPTDVSSADGLGGDDPHDNWDWVGSPTTGAAYFIDVVGAEAFAPEGCVPTVSEWGLIAMTLLSLVVGWRLYGNRPQVAWS